MTSQLTLDWRDAGPGASAISPLAARAIRDAVLECAARGDFTSDMVLDRLSFAIRECVRAHPCAMGAVFTAMAKRNEIEATDRTVRSQRDAARGRRLVVWRRRT